MRFLFVFLTVGVAAFCAGEAFPASAALDSAIEQAIGEDQIPGAVLLIGHRDKIVHRKAYGHRTMEPQPEAMTVDTIFDAASLTKIVATTAAVMKLFEQGKLRLNDRVTQYIPDFQGGTSDITVRNLLTHFSGLRPDLDLHPPWSGYETGIRLALIDAPTAPPGARFVYSDINFLLLGEIVHRLSGKTLAEFAAEEIFRPLGMKDTMFQPPPELWPRIAPTEVVEGRLLRGVVHDPTSRYMGGIAGHAGLFTTADDLSRFAEMMLGEGEREGVRIFSPLTVRKFTTPQSPPDQPILRGLGWDIDSPYSGNRGELFPVGSYGHTGFTGTSLWIDPVSRTYVILLTNSVHPYLRPAITSLRCRVGTATAAALGIDTPGINITGYNETLTGAGVRRVVARNAQVLTGLDVLAEQKFAPLHGKRVGLITNHTGLSRDGKRNVDLMLEAGVRVTALFSPEHGIAGREDHANIGHEKDPATGIPIWSLYNGNNRRPAPEMLRDVDTLVFDIQDIGARFYTYPCTMKYCMEEAAKHKIPFIVLDRPNPINGVDIDGPCLETQRYGFASWAPVPTRHGMTIGELAQYFNSKFDIHCDLTVIKMEGWKRSMWFDETGLPWLNPSPAIVNTTGEALYPCLGVLESTNLSVGRGTDLPFEQFGAEWVDAAKLAKDLNARKIPGLRFEATSFTPRFRELRGKHCQGVKVTVTDRKVLRPVAAAVEICDALHRLHGDKFVFDGTRSMFGKREVPEMIAQGKPVKEIVNRWKKDLVGFAELRKKYLLYEE